MGMSFVDSDDLQSFADAIRAQTSDSNDMVFPVDFAYAIGHMTGYVGNSARLDDYFTDLLTSLDVPYGTTSIRQHLFQNNTSLQIVRVPDTVSDITNVFSFDVGSALVEFNAPSATFTLTPSYFSHCANLDRIWLNSGVTITNMAPSDYYGLDNVSYPPLFNNLNSVTEIHFSAGTRSGALRNLCCNCENLQYLTLPNGITVLGTYIAYRCPNLMSVTIPASVTSVTGTPFLSTTSLGSITFSGTPNSIDNNAFGFIYTNSNLVINVPWSMGDVSGAPWGATSATINYNYTP